MPRSNHERVDGQRVTYCRKVDEPWSCQVKASKVRNFHCVKLKSNKIFIMNSTTQLTVHQNCSSRLVEGLIRNVCVKLFSNPASRSRGYVIGSGGNLLFWSVTLWANWCSCGHFCENLCNTILNLAKDSGQIPFKYLIYTTQNLIGITFYQSKFAL